jgi:hypothetical protein
MARPAGRQVGETAAGNVSLHQTGEGREMEWRSKGGGEPGREAQEGAQARRPHGVWWRGEG